MKSTGFNQGNSNRGAPPGGKKSYDFDHHAAIATELFTHRFTAIANEMGELLQRMATSVNVKERKDFSCGVLDNQGRLVANAPHIPVHLGALGMCVRAIAVKLEPFPGALFVTNHPAYGGSHLPDVTVAAPVFVTDRSGTPVLIGWVANRAHHAELGGRQPGSMSPFAATLLEEGVILEPQPIGRVDAVDLAAVGRRLREGPFPSRRPEENLADLSAQVASLKTGVQRLTKLANSSGAAVVADYMNRIRLLAAEAMRDALFRQGDGEYQAEERLDDGTPIRVAITIEAGHAVVDFCGSGAVHAGSYNATPAIVRSAVAYVMRLLVGKELPLNEGLLDPIDLRVPEGFLNPRFPADPELCPAVVAGNVETSQRVVDTLISALGIMACSQGTMNNLVFGNRRFGYYETIAGGSGAGPGFAGTSGVHCHMTNTRITDPEVMEERFPVRVEAFAIRHGSGGSGRYPGGDGVRRCLRFLEPLEVSLLSEHRVEEPYGGAGGEPGLRGRQTLTRADGVAEHLPGRFTVAVLPGDTLEVETPGGGGWGEPPASSGIKRVEAMRGPSEVG